MTIPDDMVDEVVAALRFIATLEAVRRDDDMSDGTQYARALGRAKGRAIGVLVVLDSRVPA